MRSVVVGRSVTTSATSATKLCGTSSNAPVNLAAFPPLPVASTLISFRVMQTNAPSSGQSRTYTVQKNGVNTSMTVTVTNPATGGVTVANPVSYAAGDTFNLSCTSTAADATGVIYFACVFSAATKRSFVLSQTAASASNSVANYFEFQGAASTTTTFLGNTDALFPTNGTLRNLYVTLSGSPGVGKSYTVTLLKNDSPTAITLTISDSATTGSDLVHSVAVVPSDLLVWEITPTGTPTARQVGVGVEFAPTIDGESIQSRRYSSSSTSVNTFSSLVGGSGSTGSSATESNTKMLFPACSIYSMYALLTGPPGAGGSGKRYTYTLRKNAADETLTFAVAETAENGHDTTHTVSVADGDFINYKAAPTSTPNSIANAIACVTYITPDNAGASFLLFG